MQYKIISNENIDKLANYIKSKGYKVTKNVFNYYIELNSSTEQVSNLELAIGRSVAIYNKELHILSPNNTNHRFN